MNDDASFYLMMAQRCCSLAQRCNDADREVARELIALGRELAARAVERGADPETIPEP
jgi:hypothetical protein